MVTHLLQVTAWLAGFYKSYSFLSMTPTFKTQQEFRWTFVTQVNFIACFFSSTTRQHNKWQMNSGSTEVSRNSRHWAFPCPDLCQHLRFNNKMGNTFGGLMNETRVTQFGNLRQNLKYLSRVCRKHSVEADFVKGAHRAGWGSTPGCWRGTSCFGWKGTSGKTDLVWKIKKLHLISSKRQNISFYIAQFGTLKLGWKATGLSRQLTWHNIGFP